MLTFRDACFEGHLSMGDVFTRDIPHIANLNINKSINFY
jgi:hypothetical protein